MITLWNIQFEYVDLGCGARVSEDWPLIVLLSKGGLRLLKVTLGSFFDVIPIILKGVFLENLQQEYVIIPIKSSNIYVLIRNIVLGLKI